jgi:type IV secretion system protein VirB4
VIKLNRIGEDYREAGALHRLVNLLGFMDSNTFLTKSGDVGVVISVRGVDYECVDREFPVSVRDCG